MSDIKNENELANYVASIENANNQQNVENVENVEMPVQQSFIENNENAEKLKEAARAAKEERDAIDNAEMKEEINRQIRQDAINKGTTLAPIPVEQLPSKGLFYPEGTKIYINAATLNDIKRWTSMDETDASDILEKMESILESCCKIMFGGDSFVRANWKDILDIDRLYLLFAIHDYTFPPGHNDIHVKLNEKDDVILKKENVKYVQFSEKLMKYYDEKHRCFAFPVRNAKLFEKTDGKMRIYMTNIGVANFFTDYIRTCNERQDTYDKDFIQYAPLLIKDWRGLTNDKYYQLIDSTYDWGTYEWSLISKVVSVLKESSITPVLQYKDNGGTEREAPLNFRDGFKGIFQQRLDIDL